MIKTLLGFVLSIVLLAACSEPTRMVANSNSDVYDLASWSQSALPSGEIIHTFTATGNSLWGVDYGLGKVLRSDDQGMNWAVAADLSPEYLETIQFVNDDMGFVSGDYGFVYKTVNGGVTWVDISPDIEGRITEPYRNDDTKDQTPDGLFVAYYDMHFKTSASGYVWGFQYNPAAGFRESHEDLLFVTSDAGLTWEKVSDDDIEPTRQAFVASAPKHQTTLAGTYYFDDRTQWRYTRADGENAIMRSVDGGTTWERSVLPEPPYERWIYRSVVFLDRSNGLAFGGSLAESDSHAVAFRTQDGGASWDLLPTDWPHVHEAKWIDGRIHVSTKRSGFFISPRVLP